METKEVKKMNYEERYKEAVGRIEDCIPDENGMIHIKPEDIFPELKESEDERIRKQILDCFRAMKRQGCFPSKHKEQYDSWIAWLEKQLAQKTVWSEEDENGLGDALWAIQQARTLAKDENDMGNLWYAENWLKSIKERHIWEPSDEQMQFLWKYAEQNNYDGAVLSSLYRDLKKLREE